MDAIAREVLQCEETFERADATARDDDVWGHAHTLAREPPAHIGDHPHQQGGKPAGVSGCFAAVGASAEA